jgi:Ca2+-binding EF-hand superfamily protein
LLSSGSTSQRGITRSLPPATMTMPLLTEAEIASCRETFQRFDQDRSGTIDVWELRQVLAVMGQARALALALGVRAAVGPYDQR